MRCSDARRHHKVVDRDWMHGSGTMKDFLVGLVGLVSHISLTSKAKTFYKALTVLSARVLLRTRTTVSVQQMTL